MPQHLPEHIFKLWKMEYYHTYTKGQQHDLLFYSEEDFIYGMNLIPKCLKDIELKILAFCLMDNHLHFIMKATREECNRFIVNYKKNLSTFLSRSGRKINASIQAGISRIDSPEYLMTSIAYVLRNPMVAGKNYLPQDYPWSSASLYFRNRERTESEGFQAIGSLTYREKRTVFKAESHFPEEWRIDNKGMILPVFYTEVAEVENIFSSVKRFIYHLSAGKEAEVNRSVGQAIRLCDSDLRKEAAKICLDKFGSNSTNQLDFKQRLLICKFLRKEFGASFKQLGRIMNIDPEYIKNLI